MKNRVIKKIMRNVLLAFIGAMVVGTFYFLWKKAQPVITVYEVVKPVKGTIETKAVATGNVEPRYEVEIKPQISGIIAEIKKEAGQMVKAGEIIATIKVIPEMVQLNSAESRVNVAEISLRQVEEVYKRTTTRRWRNATRRTASCTSCATVSHSMRLSRVTRSYGAVSTA